jgi:hypothetical protein
MKSQISDSRFLILSRKAKTGGVPTTQNPRGGDGEFPEMAEKEKSGVGWIGTGGEKAHRMPLVRQPKSIPEEKVVSRCGSYRREAVLAVVFHKARDRFA